MELTQIKSSYCISEEENKRSVVIAVVGREIMMHTMVQGWQVVAKSGLNQWFLPVKTGWQKMWVAKSGKK